MHSQCAVCSWTLGSPYYAKDKEIEDDLCFTSCNETNYAEIKKKQQTISNDPCKYILLLLMGGGKVLVWDGKLLQFGGDRLRGLLRYFSEVTGFLFFLMSYNKTYQDERKTDTVTETDMRRE